MNQQLRYPIGIQSFSEVITGGYTYVDKTQYIETLRRGSKYYFLSRPRRFGKSLFLSTLAAFYQGKRELFKGLAADKADWDWQPRPVLHVDLNTGDYASPDGLRARLNDMLTDWERDYDVQVIESSPAVRFRRVIERACEATGRKVVILVDEYDKPMLSAIDDEERADIFRTTLKAFYSNLKTMDHCIELAFLTGVARFGKVSVFSDLNNLNDISMAEKYADICGWTESELVDYFRPGIENIAKRRHENFDKTMAALRDYYDGYRFTPADTKLYNPFSVLNSLDHERINPYWFATGTPTFLAKRVRSMDIAPFELNEQHCSGRDLLQVGIGAHNPIPLLFQTGYLTIKHYDDETDSYTLGFPNFEVERGFNDELLKLYIPEKLCFESRFSINIFQRDLVDGNPEQFMQRIAALLKEMPYECHNERTYQNLVYLLCRLSGTAAQLERHTNVGRPDLEVLTRRNIYIFEFKYNGTVDDAIAQLHGRDYGGRFALDHRTVYLIAANFSASAPNRGLQDYRIEQLADR